MFEVARPAGWPVSLLLILLGAYGLVFEKNKAFALEVIAWGILWLDFVCTLRWVIVKFDFTMKSLTGFLLVFLSLFAAFCFGLFLLSRNTGIISRAMITAIGLVWLVLVNYLYYTLDAMRD